MRPIPLVTFFFLSSRMCHLKRYSSALLHFYSELCHIHLSLFLFIPAVALPFLDNWIAEVEENGRAPSKGLGGH